MNKHVAIAYVSIISMLMLSGCGTLQTYPGQRMAPSEVGVLRFGDYVQNELTIDGVRETGAVLHNKYEFLPGPHTVICRAYHPPNAPWVNCAPVTLTFDVKPGGRYVLMVKRSPPYKKTRVISSEVPAEPPPTPYGMNSRLFQANVRPTWHPCIEEDTGQRLVPPSPTYATPGGGGSGNMPDYSLRNSPPPPRLK